MRHIDTIDITNRCGIKPENTVYDFLTKVTTMSFRKKMKEIINWKNDEHISFRKVGLEAEKRYTPYLKSKLKDIPIEILSNYSNHFVTDGKYIYIYSPCCG